MAVMVVDPLPTPTARPAELMVATDVLLELQLTCPVTFRVDPAAFAPIAMNWLD